MPLFPELIAELNDALRKRRNFISPSREPIEPRHVADPKTDPLYLDGHSVYLKQKVLAQIRAYQDRQALYVSKILESVQADTSAQCPEAPQSLPSADLAAPPVSGWSLWSLLGY
jgi:hypothetical protein